MARERDLNDEHLRILLAARDERLRENEHGRYVIDGAGPTLRPARREREQLQRWGLLEWRLGSGTVSAVWLSAAGAAALRQKEKTDV